jgi:hypothetical protein
MLHNLHDNPTKEEIENENHNVKYVYSDTTMFDGETDHFTYTRIVPVDEPDESQKRLVGTGGAWQGSYDYLYKETTAEGRYLYGLVNIGDTDSNQGDGYDFEYDPSDGKFYDVGPSQPYKWATDANGTNLSDFPNTANMPILYWCENNGSLNFQFDNPFYVAPSYRYLAFYGEVGSASNGRPKFQEIELTLGTPLNGSSEIKYDVNDTGITFYESKAWDYNVDYNDYLTIMNGVKGHADPYLQYDNVGDDTNAIFWYMDMGTGVVADVNGGTFWTYTNIQHSFLLGKLYGTNTDPATFGDASLIENYEYVCDLTKQTAS